MVSMFITSGRKGPHRLSFAGEVRAGLVARGHCIAFVEDGFSRSGSERCMKGYATVLNG